MNPIIILFALPVLFVGYAVWLWRMSEKKWLARLSVRNYFDIDYSKYNKNKIKSVGIALLLFEAACFFLAGLTLCRRGSEDSVLLVILLSCAVIAPIAYWPILILFCKKSKYKNK